jgi:U3 small nucleolar ribonucleoprotein component
MSGRDHSETCATCGHERGGLNDVPCLCEAHHGIDADPRLSALNDGMAIRGVAAEAIRERDRLSQRCAELEAEVAKLKRTEKFLRYYECSDDAVRMMTEAALKAVEDMPMEGDVENLVMNLDQFRKQRDEARTDAEKMRDLLAAAVEWRMHGEGQSHCEEEGCRCTEQLLREAIDALTKPGTP